MPCPWNRVLKGPIPQGIPQIPRTRLCQLYVRDALPVQNAGTKDAPFLVSQRTPTRTQISFFVFFFGLKTVCPRFRPIIGTGPVLSCRPAMQDTIVLGAARASPEASTCVGIKPDVRSLSMVGSRYVLTDLSSLLQTSRHAHFVAEYVQ